MDRRKRADHQIPGDSSELCKDICIPSSRTPAEFERVYGRLPSQRDLDALGAVKTLLAAEARR